MNRKDDEDWVKKCVKIRFEGGVLLKDPLLWVYSLFSDMVGLPLYNSLSPFIPVMVVFSVNL